jgi:hypothetical protein
MTKPTKVNLERKRGDSYADEITVSSTSTGAVVDITGYSFLMTVDPSASPADDTNNLFQLTGTITVAASGKVEFAPTAEQTDLTPATYYHDIQMTDVSGRKRTIAAGKYVITQDITKD